MIPTATAIRAAGVLLVLGAAFAGGCRVQSWRDAGRIEKLRGELAAQQQAIRAKDAALQELQAAADARIAEAQRQAAEWRRTSELMHRLRSESDRRAADFERRLSRAMSRSEQCRLLMQSDVEAVCGVSLR